MYNFIIIFFLIPNFLLSQELYSVDSLSLDENVDCLLLDNKKEKKKFIKAESIVVKGRQDIKKLYSAMENVNKLTSPLHRSVLKTEIYWLREKYFEAIKKGVKWLKKSQKKFKKV